ncbi:MAG TPA: hypothetical protein VKB65_00710 [Myxococcota bacterium]|nr:hypothetical protein [Myxococcota bacterium]
MTSDPGAPGAAASAPGAAAGAGSPGRGPLSPTPLEWACLAAGVALLLRYAWLMDDAFVYFRYVDNLVWLGAGLVYNRGEYVEGFSSPLWALLLSALRELDLPWWMIVRGLGVASFLACGALLIAAHRRLSPRGAPVLNLPLLFVSLAYGPLCYFTSGLETPFVQVAAPLFALRLLGPAPLALDVAVALSPLLRHELALPLGLYGLFLWARDGRFPWRLFALSAVFTGAWLAFRIYYYADLFPNTFYLKNMADVPQGLIYLWNTVEAYALHLWLGLHAALWVWLRRRRADVPYALERAAMIAVSLAVTVWVVRIGGDPRHYRFLAFPVLLVLCALGGIAEQAVAQLPAARRRVAWAAGVLVFGGSMAAAYPEQLREHPFALREDARMVHLIKDAAEHRRMPQLTPPAFSAGGEIEQTDAYRRREGRAVEYDGIYLQSGCVYLYRAWDRYALHVLGLTDAILARTEMEADRPAHKLGLIPLADDMAPILRAAHGRPHRGIYRAAVEAGTAAPWIAANLDSIETIERKIYNRHDWGENLGLALTFPTPIRIEGEPAKGPDDAP